MKFQSPVMRKYFSYVIQLPGYMGLLVASAAIIFGEYLALIPLLGIAFITIIPGWIIIKKTALNEEEKQIKHPAVFAAISYGLVSVICALPIYATAVVFHLNGSANSEIMIFHTFINALFESFAGFTSSGLTMVEKPEELPYVILLWRSLSQWIGGFGIIILAVYIFTPKAEGTSSIIQTEVGNVDVEEHTLTAVRKISWIYIGITIAAFFLYLMVKEPLWISLNHALTTVSTGGFTVTNDSFEYQSLASKLASLLFMIIGAMSFDLHRDFISNKSFNTIRKYKENLFFLFILFAGTIALLTESYFSVAAPAWIDNIYQWISAFTTSGYQTADLNNWEGGKLFLLSLAMLIGGVAGSTAGGLKVKRLMLLINIFSFNFTKKNKEKYEEKIHALGEGDNTREILSNFITLFGIWLLVLTVSVVIISFLVSGEYRVVEVFFEVVSAQSNVGLSTGLTHADSHWFIKIDFIFLMWMGRLEIIAVLMLFVKWRLK